MPVSTFSEREIVRLAVSRMCPSNSQCDSILASGMSLCCLGIKCPSLRDLHLPRRIQDGTHQAWLFPAFRRLLSAAHSSHLPQRSARLISSRLCVSCHVFPTASLAPLAKAAARFQTPRTDECLPEPKCARCFN